MKEKLQILADLISKETLEHLNKIFPENLSFKPDMWARDSKTRIIPGTKYTKIDVGDSGKYMIDNKTQEIFGIKAYGVVRKGHRYGTLDTINNYYWGNYRAQFKEVTP